MFDHFGVSRAEIARRPQRRRNRAVTAGEAAPFLFGFQYAVRIEVVNLFQHYCVELLGNFVGIEMREIGTANDQRFLAAQIFANAPPNAFEIRSD